MAFGNKNEHPDDENRYNRAVICSKSRTTIDILTLRHVLMYGDPEQALTNSTIVRHSGNTSLYVVLIAASAAISGLLFGYDTAVINGALVYLRLDFKLSPFETDRKSVV